MKRVAMNDRDVKFFERLLIESVGVRLPGFTPREKKQFFHASFDDHVRELGMSYSSYRKWLATLPVSHPELAAFAGLARINRTSFFRAPSQFEFVVSHLKKRGREHALKIWSAACSTGEEPVTLALMLENELGRSADFKILATDMSPRVLEWAKFGAYRRSQVRAEVPAPYRKHFRVSSKTSVYLKLDDSLARRIRYERRNLAQDKLPPERFDVIFCRNVLYYFDAAAAAAVIERLRGRLRAGGLLVLGYGEKIRPARQHWRPVARGIFAQSMNTEAYQL